MTIEEFKRARVKYEKYCKELDLFQLQIGSTRHLELKLKALKELYEYVKKISLELYRQDEEFEKNYCAISIGVLRCEKLIPNTQITNIKPKFENGDSQTKDIEGILNYIVNSARNFILSNNHNKEINNLEDVNMVSLCLPVSSYIESLCKSLKIECKKIGLFPGFTASPVLYNGLKQHYFVIVEFDNRKFLIDCTYAQFFSLNRSILERIGLVKLSGCSAGIFMMIDPERKKVAQKVLQDGWIELERDNLKHYLDGFACSYRNGLYYEKTLDFSYHPEYSTEQYKKFLINEDSQLSHEGDTIGYQLRPLEDPKMNFYSKI